MILLVASLLLSGGATAWSSLDQSLWLDELHTSWSASDTLAEVAARAAVGNQLPLYFWWQWWLTQTVGTAEPIWRCTSLLAWCTMLSLLTGLIWRRAKATGQAGLWVLLAAAAVDRNQIFFATEARPYALLALVVLAAWWTLAGWLRHQRHETATPKAWYWWLAWSGLNLLALWIQPTAVLSLAAQVVYLLTSLLRHRSALPQARRLHIKLSLTKLSLTLLAVIVLWLVPASYVLVPAWQGRRAWAAFAADLRVWNVLSQLPVIAVAVPTLAACAVSWFNSTTASVRAKPYGFEANDETNHPTTQHQARQPKHSKQFDQHADDQIWLWLCAWLLPWLGAWLLTATGIAPLLHPRYTFVGAVPLLLWSACLLVRLPSRGLCTAAAMGILLLLTWQQSSLSVWSTGQLASAVRHEDWRAATAQINSYALASKAANVQVYCASNLIEGSQPEFAGGSALREQYLSLPVRSVYRLPQRAQTIALSNDPATWPGSFARADDSTQGVAGQRWLLVRCSAVGLAKRLQASSLQPLDAWDYGSVQLLRF